MEYLHGSLDLLGVYLAWEVAQEALAAGAALLHWDRRAWEGALEGLEGAVMTDFKL